MRRTLDGRSGGILFPDLEKAGKYVYTAYTCGGTAVPLGEPLEAALSIEEDAPADAFSGVFPFPWKEAFEASEAFEEFGREKRTVPVFLEICREGRGEVFFGPIDELRHRVSSEGCALELAARSRAALLLDNEAVPQTYLYPSLPLLFKRHGEPYGFSEWEGETGGFSEPFTVTKGMSEWEVLALFCSRYLKAPLRARGRKLQALRERGSGRPRLHFGGDIPLLECAVEEKFCERYSEILVRPENTEAYTLSVAGRKAQELGLRRRRLLNGSEDQAREALRKAEKRAFCAELLVPGLPVPGAGVGTFAALTLPDTGETLPDLYVSGLRYSLSSSGESCRYYLRRRGEED